MTWGFSNAALPALLALERSHAANPVEADLQQLFIDLFRSQLAAKVFDANAAGMPHLGSFDLVRRAVNADGLVLLPGSREEAATRYLYRAWKSRNSQGRGLHFLRTYLQMLFPNGCEVRQLWHNQDHPYPRGLVAAGRPRAWWLHQLGESGLKLDGHWGVGERVREANPSRVSDPARTDGLFLTSRIDIAVDFSVEVPSIAGLLHIVRSIIPARLVPSFSFLMGVDVLAGAALVSSLQMRKSLSVRLGWPGRVIGESADTSWQLGVDGVPIRLPRSAGILNIGHFKLGGRHDGLSSWRIKSGRIESNAVLHAASEAQTAGSPRLGDAWRRLDGSWQLGRRSVHVSRSASLLASSEITLTSSVETRFSERVRMDLQGTPNRLGCYPRLSSWRRLDGRWLVGAASRPLGFPIRRDESILIESQGIKVFKVIGA